MMLSEIIYSIIKNLNTDIVVASNANIIEALFTTKKIKINNEILNEVLLFLIENNDIVISINKNNKIVYFSREITWIEIIENLLKNHMKEEFFTLDNLYRYENKLKQIFPSNNNIKAKIRQTLQILRDNKTITFLNEGKYLKYNLNNYMSNIQEKVTFSDKLNENEKILKKTIFDTIKLLNPRILEFDNLKFIGYRYQTVEGRGNPYWFWIRRCKKGALEFVLRKNPTSKMIYVTKINQINIKNIIEKIEDVLLRPLSENTEKKMDDVEGRSHNNQVEQNVENKIEFLYRKIIEGYIIFKNDFIDIVLGHDVLLNVFDTKQHKKSKTLYKYFKWFEEYNFKEINQFLNDEIDHDMFETMCLNKEKRIIKEIFKPKYFEINRLYDLFLNTVMFFDYREKNFNFSDLNVLLDYYNFKSLRYKNFDFLNKYWNIFLNLNENSKIHYEFMENKKIFSQAISSYNNIEHVFKKLKNINESNFDYYIDSIFNINSINIKLRKNNIITINDFTKLSFDDFINIFESQEELEEAEIIISYLQENVNKLIKKYYFDVIDYCNHQPMVIRRANGETLNSIAVDYGLTRERVRQIVDKSNKIYMKTINRYSHNLLKLLNKTGSYVLENQLDDIFKNNSDVAKFYLKYIYKNKSDVIIIDYKFKELLSFIVNWIETLAKDYYFINELEQVSSNLKSDLERINLYFSKNIIKHLLINNFFKEGSYYFKSSPTLVDKYEVILRYHFTKGLTQENINQFKDEYFNVYKDFSIYEKNDRTVFSRAVDNNNIVLKDRGTYIYRKPGSIKLDHDTLIKIEKFILDNKTVYTANILYLFKENLIGKIDNRYELHSVLKEHFPNFYFRRDVIGVSEKPSLFIGHILEEFALKNEGYVYLDNIEKKIPILAGISLDGYVANNRRFVGVSNNVLIHKSYLHYDEAEIEFLNKIITRDLQNKIPVRTNKVYDYMKKYAPNVFKKNKIHGNVYAYNLFKHFYPKGFLYDFPFIRWDLENLGYKTDDYIFSEFASINIFEIKDIINFSKDMGLVINNMKVLLEKFYNNGYMRINDVIIGKTEEILNNMTMVTDIVNTIFKLLKKVRQINLDTFDFNLLPNINVPWNKHLLSHLLINAAKKSIEVITDGVTYNNLNYILRKKVY